MGWTAPPEPATAAIDPGGWLRVAWRGPVIAALILGGLVVLLTFRLLERPFSGPRRPLSNRVTVAVCRGTLAVMGLRVAVRGRPMAGAGALVANHTSWLDIFVLNARMPVTFVAKSEVAGWPGIGWLARAAGTLFIRRDPREARAQTQAFEARLAAGARLVFFPEGTSTDGRQVLAFKTTLFAAFLNERLRHRMTIQPVSVIYRDPPGARTAFYGWWGGMDFAPSALEVLSQRRQGSVTLVLHPPVWVDDFPNRKSLAAHLETTVREGHANG